MPNQLSFRQLVRDDLPLLHRWLNEEPALTWYAKRPLSIREVESKYVPRIEALDPVHVYVFSVGDINAGIIQAYVLKDFPEYARLVQGESDWAGIDFLIGEVAFRGVGLAPRVVEAFTSQFVFPLGHYTCCSSPDAANERSIRTLLRAGFRHVRTVTFQSGAVERLMVRHASA